MLKKRIWQSEESWKRESGNQWKVRKRQTENLAAIGKGKHFFYITLYFLLRSTFPCCFLLSWSCSWSLKILTLDWSRTCDRLFGTWTRRTSKERSCRLSWGLIKTPRYAWNININNTSLVPNEANIFTDEDLCLIFSRWFSILNGRGNLFFGTITPIPAKFDWASIIFYLPYPYPCFNRINRAPLFPNSHSYPESFKTSWTPNSKKVRSV